MFKFNKILYNYKLMDIFKILTGSYCLKRDSFENSTSHKTPDGSIGLISIKNVLG